MLEDIHINSMQLTLTAVKTLASRQLILGGMTVDDGVTLSFWVPGGGIGNGPDEEDSLIVEFKSIELTVMFGLEFKRQALNQKLSLR